MRRVCVWRQGSRQRRGAWRVERRLLSPRRHREDGYRGHWRPLRWMLLRHVLRHPLCWRAKVIVWFHRHPGIVLRAPGLAYDKTYSGCGMTYVVPPLWYRHGRARLSVGNRLWLAAVRWPHPRTRHGSRHRARWRTTWRYRWTSINVAIGHLSREARRPWHPWARYWHAVLLRPEVTIWSAHLRRR